MRPPRPRAMERKTVEAPRFMMRAVSSMNTACTAGTEFRIQAQNQSSERQRIGYEHRLQPGTEFRIRTGSEFKKAWRIRYELNLYIKKLRTR